MKLPYMADQCEQMLKISSEFVRLQVSHDEYLCMKVLLLLSTGQTSFLSFFFFYLRAAERLLPLSHVERGAVLMQSLQKPLLQFNIVHGCWKIMLMYAQDITSQHFPNSLTDMQLS